MRRATASSASRDTRRGPWKADTTMKKHVVCECPRSERKWDPPVSDTLARVIGIPTRVNVIRRFDCCQLLLRQPPLVRLKPHGLCFCSFEISPGVYNCNRLVSKYYFKDYFSHVTASPMAAALVPALSTAAVATGL